MRARTLLLMVGASASVLLLSLLVGRPTSVRAQPFTPRDDAQILEHLPQRFREDAVVGSRQPEIAEQRARQALQRYFRSADPRHLGRAEAELAAFWEASDPPVPIAVLRAKLRATNHEFEPALRELTRVLERAPTDAQALLERATIATVVGRYDQARADCQRLAPLVSELFALGCSASVRGVTGEARAAADELSLAVERLHHLSSDDRGWAESLLGELRLRSGDVPRAEQSLRRALEATPDDPYTLSTLADLLLDAGRPREVVPLLARLDRVDALLLRLAIAEKQLDLPLAGRHTAELAERFADARLRGSDVHRREEARFELRLQGHPRRSLELALANFEVQREPWDVRLLLEAALACEQPERAQPAVDFVKRSGLEDMQVRRLLTELRP